MFPLTVFEILMLEGFIACPVQYRQQKGQYLSEKTKKYLPFVKIANGFPILLNFFHPFITGKK